MSVCLALRTSLVLTFALFACVAHAASDQELAQQCRERVAKIYRDTWPKGVTDDGGARAKFDSHYNSKLGKCLFLETVSGVSHSPALKRILPREIQRLRDADANRNLGRYDRWDDEAPVTCWVQEKKCSSKEEWQQLIKPYLED